MGNYLTEFAVNIGFDFVSAAVMLTILCGLAIESSIRSEENYYFSALTGSGLMACLLDLFSWVAMEQGGATGLAFGMAVASFCAGCCYLLFFNLYLLFELRKKSFIFKGAIYPIAFFCGLPCILMLVGATQPKPWFFTITQETGYIQYDSYVFLKVLIAAIGIFDYFLVISCSKDLKTRELLSWFAFMTLPVVAMCLQGITRVYISFMYGAMMLSTLIIYMNIHLANTRQMLEQEKELGKSQMRLMVSQIQPHFLYNSLNSIYYLIDRDPETAKDAVSTFSDYLRRNINSLKNDQPVNVKDELSHVDAYVKLEELRFGDELKIKRDIQATDFSLPPLTIQPLVENAIKHGVTQKDGGGTVSITTLEAEKDYRVIVQDDGVGFVPGQITSDDKHTHVGLSNISGRLEAMSNGTLEIESEPGVGTTCTIIIPKQKQ